MADVCVYGDRLRILNCVFNNRGMNQIKKKIMIVRKTQNSHPINIPYIYILCKIVIPHTLNILYLFKIYMVIFKFKIRAYFEIEILFVRGR